MGMPLSMIVGSPLSGFLMDMDGMLGFHGWQWMFVVEGLLASFIGLFALTNLVDRPQNAKWITAYEKKAHITELEEEIANKPSSYTNPWKVLIDFRVLFLSMIYLCVCVAGYGITFYLPSQIAGILGVKVGLTVGLVGSIPWICALLALLIVSPYSDRSGNRADLASLLMLIDGLAIMFSTTSNPVYAISALCIALSANVAIVPSAT
jgi:MFS family permease